MKTALVTLATVCWVSISEPAFGQRVLDRVEQLIRRQLDAPAGPTPATSARGADTGYLGMVGDDRQDPGKGVRILNVTPGGPAAAGGLQAGDLITSINAQPVRGISDMVRAIGGLSPGTKLNIVVERNGAEARHDVTVGRRPSDRTVEDLPAPTGPPGESAASGPRLGVRTLEVSPEAQRQNNLPDAAGAMVISITPGSSAARAGISLGAVITAVDGQKIGSPQELAAAIRQSGGGEIELTYVFGGEQSKKRLSLTTVPEGPPPASPRRGRPAIAAEARRPPAPTLAEGASAESRIDVLEARIRELEQRVESLEAAAARDSK